MKNSPALFFFLIIIFVGEASAQSIRVNAGNIIRKFDHNPAGINLDY